MAAAAAPALSWTVTSRAPDCSSGPLTRQRASSHRGLPVASVKPLRSLSDIRLTQQSRTSTPSRKYCLAVRAEAEGESTSSSTTATTTATTPSASNSTPAPSPAAAAPSASFAGELVPDTGFSITKVSFGTIGLSVGVSLLVFGFGAYFNLIPGGSVSAIALTYGFPLALIGFALKYAELKPVPCETFATALALREKEATPILQQVRNDVTRYRYGDEQHLDEALKRIFKYNQGGGIARRTAPKLTSVKEEVTNGRYTLTLVFTAPYLPANEWTSRVDKFSSFFGPGVKAEVVLPADPATLPVLVKLVTTA